MGEYDPNQQPDEDRKDEAPDAEQPDLPGTEEPARHRDPEGEGTPYVRREDTPDA